MTQKSIVSIVSSHLLLLPFSLSPLFNLLIGGISAFLLTYLFTFGVIFVCRKIGWLDRPAERRVHKVPVPRLGGVAIFLAFVVASILFYAPGKDLPKVPPQILFGHVYSKEFIIYLFFIAAATLIVTIHAYDDVKGLKPLTKLLAQTATVLIILGPGRQMFHGVLLYGFNNPFYGPTNPAGHMLRELGIPLYSNPVITLFIDEPVVSLMAIPAVLFTWFWIVGMMNTVNLIDGLDGLATGVTAITGLFITIISWTLHQYSIAILAGIFTGAVLGFLPHNWKPAKIFMGDSGSQFLGLGLAVLSIMGGAKLALALMVLGLPILDVAVVMINRVRRGQHPLHYDKTHLHYRLLATGLSVKQICYVFYGLTIAFGVLALNLSRLYKLIGMSLVGVTMVALIIWIDYRQRQRGIRIKLDSGPLPTAGGNGSSTPAPEEEPGKKDYTTSSEKQEMVG